MPIIPDRSNAFAVMKEMEIKKKEKMRKERIDTRRYWVTTLISLFALIVSLISLAAQLGIINLPVIF